MRGDNVIAIAARDVQSAEGLLFEADLLWGRNAIAVVSDGSWKALGEAPEGWTEPGFDDSAWPDAVVIARAGEPPWGDVPYTYHGPREAIALSRVTLPAQINAGYAARVGDARPPATVADHPVRRLCCATMSGIVLEPTGHRVARHQDGVQVGPIEVRTSRFLSPGAYQVALGWLRAMARVSSSAGCRCARP